MKMIRLGELAEVRISNVDKKSKPTESQVLLCNFTDVYNNWAITNSHLPHLMRATANNQQIDKFSLKKGDVAITKDSETRDDIGMSAYIADDFSNVVLGYHCALIKPNSNLIDGKYLNAFLNTSTARKYFSNFASGSGQRYTLIDSSIKDIKIPLISLNEQKKIGNVFSHIDAKIENNNSIIQTLEETARTIYDYWFLQFEFPNEKGRPYKSSGGKMAWNDELKREIPEGWIAASIDSIASMQFSSVMPVPRTNYFHYSIPAFDKSQMPVQESGESIQSNKYFVPENAILVSKLNPQFKRIWNVMNAEKNSICSTEFIPFIPLNKGDQGYVFEVLNSDSFSQFMNQSSSSSTGSRKRMQPESVHGFVMPIPPLAIQISYSKKIESMLGEIENAKRENQWLLSLRNFVLPLLISGQVKLG